MRMFDPAMYTVNDFIEWNDKDQLVLSPKFQRRSVWKDVAKSFLIDSLLRDKPLPKIFIRQITDISTRKTVREVVDGQQRLRTIIDYINDGFKVKRSHNEQYGDLFFSQLPDEIKANILDYKFSVDILKSVDDSEVMDVFSRLNTYTTPLNKQELINAEFFGYFKQLVYKISYKYNNFWTQNGVFSEYQIMRMNEVELTADLIIAMLDGIQNRKVVKQYYKKYDEEFELQKYYEEIFDEIIYVVSQIFESKVIRDTFRKPALFYSLFLALYNLKYQLKSFNSINLKEFDKKLIAKLKYILEGIIIIINKDVDERTKEENIFVTYISRATSDSESRKQRTKYLINQFNAGL